MNFTRLFFLLYCIMILCSKALSQEQTDSATVQKRDSIVYVSPIPSIGSIQPFDSTIKTIPAQRITWEEYRSLYDILSVQQDVFIRDLASPGQQNQISINGLSDKNLALMVDGIPYNDFFTGTFNLWLIPVDAIDRIEFINTSQSIFYNGFSAAGAINIITKSYDNNRPMTNLRYSQGVFGYTHTDAFFAQNLLRGMNLSLGLSHYGYGSNKEFQNYRGRFFNSNDDAWTFRSKIRYNIFDWLNLSFVYLYNKTWTGLHGGVDYNNSVNIFDELNSFVVNEESYEKYSNSHYTLTAALYPFADSTLLTTISLYRFDRLREYRDEENRSVIRNGIFTKRNFASLTHGIKLQQYAVLGFNHLYGYIDYENINSQQVVTVGLKNTISLTPLLTLSPFTVVRDFHGKKLIHAGGEVTLYLTSTVAVFGSFTDEIVNDNALDVNTVSNLYLYDPEYLQNRESFSMIEAGGRVSIPSLLNGTISYRRTTQKNPVLFDTIPLNSSFVHTIPSQYSYDAISASAHVAIGEFHAEGTAQYLIQPNITRNNRSLTLYPSITLYGSAYFHGLLAKGSLDLKVGIRGRYYSKQTGMRPYDEIGVWIPSSTISYGPSGSMDFFAIGKIGDAYIHFIWENVTGNDYLLAPFYPLFDRNIRFGVSWAFWD